MEFYKFYKQQRSADWLRIGSVLVADCLRTVL